MVKNLASGPVYFGIIPHDHWYQPDWIDEEKAEAGRNQLVDQGVIYGGTSSVTLFSSDYLTSFQAVFRKFFCTFFLAIVTTITYPTSS
jgi:hypothetical protein